jgi:phosphoglycerol transferase MdoB-like AlkP superfamily enzyme
LFIYLALNSFIFILLLRFGNVISFLAIYGIQALYLLIHLAYALYFDAPFHSRQLILDLREGILLARHAAIPINIKYWAIIFDLPLVIAIILNYSKIRHFLCLTKKMTNRILWGFAIFLLVLIPVAYPTYSISETHKTPSHSEMIVIDRLGLLGNDIVDFVLYKGEASTIRGFQYGQKLVFQSKTPGRFQNIICIQVESLDANVIDYQYKNQPIVPFLHQLSSEAIYFPHTIFYRFAGASSDTEFTVLNGVLPARDFPSFKLRNYNYPNSILKPLLRSGYSTIAFHNNVGDVFNRKVAYFNMGFQDFDDRIDMGLEEKGWGASDGDMMDYVKKRLKKQTKPFFYYVTTMSSHEPFIFVWNYYRNVLYSDIKSKEIRNFFNSLSYVDGVLKDFVTFVKSNFNDAYIFIYGDHNAYSLYDPAVFQNRGVPLFIITPDNVKYRENKEIASLLDLSSTILYASGVNFEIMTRGVNLLDLPMNPGSIAVKNCRVSSRDYLFGADLTPEFRNACS